MQNCNKLKKLSFLFPFVPRPHPHETVIISKHGSLQRQSQETVSVAGTSRGASVRHLGSIRLQSAPRSSDSNRQAQKRRRPRTSTQAHLGSIQLQSAPRSSDSNRQAQKRRLLRRNTQASHGKLASVRQIGSRRTCFPVVVGVSTSWSKQRPQALQLRHLVGHPRRYWALPNAAMAVSASKAVCASVSWKSLWN